MKIIEITEDTENYKNARIQNNYNILVACKGDQNIAQNSRFFMKEYKRIFCITTEDEKGFIEKIRFGFQTDQDEQFPDIIADRLCYPLIIKIYAFCKKYREEILCGKDILEILESDQENILIDNQDLSNFKKQNVQHKSLVYQLKSRFK